MREMKIKDRLIVILTFVIVAFFVFSSNVQAGTMTVNSNADSNVCNDFLTLREAMLLGSGGNNLGRPLTTGERNQISGATFSPAPPPINCSFTASYWQVTSGVGGGITDNIVFSNGVTNILITSGLPNITWAEDIINGLKVDGTKVAIDGTIARIDLSAIDHIDTVGAWLIYRTALQRTQAACCEICYASSPIGCWTKLHVYRRCRCRRLALKRC